MVDAAGFGALSAERSALAASLSEGTEMTSEGDEDLATARAIADEFKRRVGRYAPVELGNCAVYAGQSENYRRWELACIAARRELDWREFISLPLPGANDPTDHGRLMRRLCELFPRYVYDWHSVARFFSDHLCLEAFDDWLRACVDQCAELPATDFLRAPRPEVIRELEQWKAASTRPSRAKVATTVDEVRARMAAALGGLPDGADVSPKNLS